jgi:HD superfamily phosphodiesterase
MTGPALVKVNRILDSAEFAEFLEKNKECEKDRMFCRHDLTHLLSVARIGQILNLQRGYNLDAECVYAAALLHDIGRFRQYADKTPHEEASAVLAVPELEKAGFNAAEINEISDAIKLHRYGGGEPGSLAHVLFTADKLSRNCKFCKAARECVKAYKNSELISV